MSMKRSKKIVAVVAATVMAMASLSAVPASAYSSQASWNTSYLKDQPSNTAVTWIDSCSIYSYGGGYQVYCSSLSGATDRYVKVYGDVSTFNMTSTGYSSKKTITTSSSKVTFKFAAQSGTSGTIAKASGTVGYYG